MPSTIPLAWSPNMHILPEVHVLSATMYMYKFNVHCIAVTRRNLLLQSAREGAKFEHWCWYRC